MKKLTRKALRWLYLAHRWLGIFACLLFVLWFVSGVIMMYVSFPALTDAERVRYLPHVDTAEVMVTPDAAMAIAHQQQFPQDIRLQMLLDEPVYRITGWGGDRAAVSAVDGRIVQHVDPEQARRLAQRMMPSAHIAALDIIERDQWSVPQRYDGFRPLYRIAFDDADNTEIYISSRGGDIVLDTTRTERIWCWLGHVLHWIYFTDLRAEQPLWRQVVLWLSGAGIVGAVSGIWIGILRVRLRTRYKRGTVSPYNGWMLWHHSGGLLGGFFVLTWIVSGWLSMSPNQWLQGAGVSQQELQRYAGNTAPSTEISLQTLQSLDAGDDVREIRFVWIAGQPLLLINGPLADDSPKTFLQSASVLSARSGEVVTLAADTLFASAQAAMEGVAMNTSVLHDEDHYWYSHHHQRELPVLRAMFNDADGTWLHIEPHTGQILGKMDVSSRADRWLFNAMHTLDFRFLTDFRPAWDIMIWTLSLTGLIISASGVVIGCRRLSKSF